ncbi:MAG: ECF transporter S component [Eubacteriales bacterium]
MIVIKNAKVRRLLKILVPALFIPGVIAAGSYIFRDRNYFAATLAVAMLSLVLFIAGFERKKTGTRRLIIVAVMVALSVAGRFIPFFKPVTALTVITGAYLGGEAGFLAGSMSAVISNFYFGQGPWTPFQMFAWGLVGLFAGLLGEPLRRSRALVVLYGAVAGVTYSVVMDVWTVLWYNKGFDPALYLAALGTALPHTLLYTASNAVFLWLCARPFGEKLDRVKIKYGV